MSTIAKKSFLIMASNILAAVIGFIALTSMTRFVGHEYGSLMWAMSFVATFNAISDLGFSAAHVKKVSEGQDLASCISTFAVVKMALTGLMILGSIGFLFLYTGVMGKEIFSSSLEVLLLFVLYWALCDLSSIFITTYNAKRESSKSELIHLADPLIRSPILVILAIGQMSAFYLALAYVIGALSMVLVGYWLMSRDGVRYGRPVFVRSYVKFAKPLILITIVGALLASVDKVVLGYFWDDLQVGYYTSSYKLMELVLTFGAAINVLLFPTFSEWHSKGMVQEIEPISNEAQRFISMIGMPVTAFLLVFSYPVSQIVFGSGFVESGGPMFYMAIALYIALVVGIFEQIVLAYNRPDLMVRIFIVRMAVNMFFLGLLVPTSLLGVPMLGMQASGTALAFLCGLAVYGLMVVFTVHQISGVWPYRRLWLHLLGGAITASVLYLVSLWQPMQSVLDFLALALMAEIVFFMFLAITREFRKKDLELILSVLDPRTMLQYVRDEVSKK
ncbi:MAG: oligosaccharide flippase family protein [Candidatus Methanomethylophilaceae archaeon]|nr:oligosaccharide flippase family protein [Candidatus Methanomethylophilaceae archaeon]